MAASTYDMALARVLKHEGGYTNHPSDPGGPTNFGITLHDYRRYIDRSGKATDVRNMKLADAAKIYRARYWDALRCDELPAGLDYAVFDYGVNSGIARAARVIRRLMGLAAGDVLHDAAIAAIGKADPQTTISRLCDERLAFLRSLSTWPVFGAGWGRRVAEVRRDGLAMAQGKLVPAAASQPGGGKGEVPRPARAQAGTAAGSVAAGAGAAQIAHASGAPLSVTLAFIAAGIVLAAAGCLAFHLWRRHRQEAPMPDSSAT
jgi:lysozyme family protein